ncbi:helix-turn-helix transcriptional regulator [Plantactinospora soyae]|uniref:DNA-binding CsgD family transcriptional regulator n=1 Tax=Plantactinospora soyae TaxID=1544732 RepID=A0A927R923_9ACTN|nr:LuxR family transcriptional regulator [Plantactinospora soyae]MBE1489361.1 DNA-binding CsgD family transcriptional regulator [Plantactinospora soyae]
MVVAPAVQIPVLRGRARQQAAITGLLRRTAEGAGGALMIEGAPGTGRSALLGYAARQAATFTRLSTDGLLGEDDLPLAALHRLGIGPRGRRPRTTDQRLALCASVLDAVVAMSRERPVLCTVDDVEWVDPPSLEALTFVARRARHHRVAMLFAGGSGPPVGGSVLRLAPLEPTAAREVLADHGITGDIAAPLVELAAGNPAALLDLVRAAPGQPPPTRLPVDGALHRAYHVRLRTLPPATRRVLLMAALDASLDPGVLARLGADALAPAERIGLVRIGVGFPHPVVREVIRDDATLADRQHAHRTLARVLTGMHRLVHLAAVTAPPNARLADEIAHAVDAAGDCALASAALARAAELTPEPARAAERRVAAARYAWLAGDPQRACRLATDQPADAASGERHLLRGEMSLHAGTASAALDHFVAAADALAGSRPDLAWRALVRAGEAVCLDGNHVRYGEVVRRAARLRRSAGTAPLPSAQVAGLAAVLRGDHVRARPALRSVLAQAERVDDPESLVSAATAGLLLGDDAATHRALERGIGAAHSAGAVALLPRALELRTFVEYWTGSYETATASAREGLVVARSCGQAAGAGNLVGLLALLAAVRGDRAGCLCWMRELHAGSHASRPRALVQWALAVLDLIAGRHGDALRRLSTMADPSTGSGNVLIQMTAAPFLVEAAAGAGDPSVAATAASVFERWAAATGDGTRQALAARCRALLLPRGSPAALAEFGAALDLHPPDGSEFERARTALLLGRELRRSRRPRDARPHLHRAAEGFALVDMPVWVAAATAELRAAGEAGDLPAPTGPALTAQQRRIAELVAAGATNREVAAQLNLSTRTVDHHLRNIFSRLGVRSRTELARSL